jgi:hypothetical protein
MIRPTVLVRFLVLGLLTAVCSAPAWAQETTGLPASGMAQQSLRPYWHVFIAYAVTIVLVLGWVMSISRRLKDVEDRLQE